MTITKSHKLRTAATFASAGSLALLATMGLAGPTAVASPSKGAIRVHLTVDNQPQKGIKLCATSKAGPKQSSVEGNCHETNKKGYATLTDVPRGHWFVTVFYKSNPANSSTHRVAVKGGETTNYHFALRPS